MGARLPWKSAVCWFAHRCQLRTGSLWLSQSTFPAGTKKYLKYFFLKLIRPSCGYVSSINIHVRLTNLLLRNFYDILFKRFVVLLACYLISCVSCGVGRFPRFPKSKPVRLTDVIMAATIFCINKELHFIFVCLQTHDRYLLANCASR